LDPVAELREYRPGHRPSGLRDEEETDAFDRISRTVCSIESTSAFEAPSKSRWASSTRGS
jgi:hypothetical protein